MESNTTNFLPEAPYSTSTFHMLGMVVKVFVSGSVSLCGIITNTVNIIVFYKQGIMSHSSIVSLTGLAISDLIICVLALWSSISAGIFHSQIDTSTWKWEVIGFMIFTSFRPLNVSSQITCWITAFATFERVISVTFPFKVKLLFTPSRSLIAIICIFAGTIFVGMPNLLEEFAVWETNPLNNVTYIGWQPSKVLPYDTLYAYYIANVAFRFISILIVALCNIVIIWKVKLSKKFRKGSANESNKSKDVSVYSKEDSDGTSDQTQAQESNPKSTKEMKLLRMITVISVVFTICYSLTLPRFTLFYMIWNFNVDYHWYIDQITWNIDMLCQLINSSVNLFIYYKMSSRFKEEFQLLFNMKQK